MASLSIKGIPEDLLDELRRSAERHRRSLNSEVLHLLECAVGPARFDPEVVLARIHRLQERTGLPPLTDEILDRAIDTGRP